MAPQTRGGQNSKKKPPNATKASSKTPTKFFVCFYIVVRV
jgi:hypothetical protein